MLPFTNSVSCLIEIIPRTFLLNSIQSSCLMLASYPNRISSFKMEVKEHLKTHLAYLFSSPSNKCVSSCSCLYRQQENSFFPTIFHYFAFFFPLLSYLFSFSADYPQNVHETTLKKHIASAVDTYNNKRASWWLLLENHLLSYYHH